MSNRALILTVALSLATICTTSRLAEADIEPTRGILIFEADGALRAEVRGASALQECILFRSGFEDLENLEWSEFIKGLGGLLGRLRSAKGEMPGDFDVGVSTECHAVDEWTVVEARTFRSARCVYTSSTGASTCTAHPLPIAPIKSVISGGTLSDRHRRQILESIDKVSGLFRIPWCADCKDLQFEILSALGAGPMVKTVASLANQSPAQVVGLFVDGLSRSPSDAPGFDLGVAADSVLADACACASDGSAAPLPCTSLKAVAVKSGGDWKLRCFEPGSKTGDQREWTITSATSPLVLPAACKGAVLKPSPGSQVTLTALGDGQRRAIGPSWFVEGKLEPSSVMLETGLSNSKACKASGSGITVLEAVQLKAPPMVRLDAPPSSVSCVRGEYPLSGALTRIEVDYPWQCLAAASGSQGGCGDFRLRVISSPWLPLGLNSTEATEPCIVDPTAAAGDPMRLYSCPASKRLNLESRMRLVLPLHTCP